ncbi:MAG: serine/threonine-protein kinase [Chloroflexota bacterium]
MRLIANRYQIKALINEGGMGKVYRAIDMTIGRRVAIKFIHSHRAADDTTRRRFIKEVQAVIQIDHHAIVPIYDFGNEEGELWFVMKYMERGSLADLMGIPLSFDLILKTISRISAAVDQIHQAGFLHRDIKPGNILIDQHGDAYLGDFGITKALKSNENLTGSRFIGTPKYMSPEQFESASEAPAMSAQSDFYALGMVVYEMLCGSNPYSGKTTGQLIMAKLHDPLPSLNQYAPDLPPGLNEIIQKAAATDPADRYDTAQEFYSAFEQEIIGLSDHVPINSREDTHSTIKIKPDLPVNEPKSSWYRYVLGGGGLLTLLIIGGAFMTGIFSNQERNNPPSPTPSSGTVEPIALIVEADPSPTAKPTATEIPAVSTETASPLPAETIEAFPTASATFTPPPIFTSILLDSVSTLTEPTGDLGVPVGQVEFEGIPFDFGWKFSTQCGNSEAALARPKSANLGLSIPNPQKLHLLFQGGDMGTKYNKQSAGFIELEFSSGETFNLPLTVGFNIRDWQRENMLFVTALSSSSQAVSVHESVLSNGSVGGIDLLTLEFTPEQQASTLISIRIEDTSSEASPCLHIMAATVEQ